MTFNLIVCSLSQAKKLHYKGWPDVVVSTLDPIDIQRLPKMANSHLRLAFTDTEIGDSLNPPEQHHVEQALAWYNSIDYSGSNVLFHCFAGLCRSTAMAIGFCINDSMRVNPSKSIDSMIEEAFNRVELVRPQLWPNMRLLSFYDNTLGLDGGLFEYATKWRQTKMKFKIF